MVILYMLYSGEGKNYCNLSDTAMEALLQIIKRLRSEYRKYIPVLVIANVGFLKEIIPEYNG